MKNIISILTTILVLTTLQTKANFVKDGSPEKKDSQTKISGYVIDKSTGESLSGVKIKIGENGLTFYTNIDGYYEIENTSGKDVSLSFDYVSYQSIKVDSPVNNEKIELLPKDIIE